MEIIKRTRITEDFSNYDPLLSTNGGKYGFWSNLTLGRLTNGRYLVYIGHNTTSEFDYCPLCGNFTDTNEYIEDLFAVCHRCKVNEENKIKYFSHLNDAEKYYEEQLKLKSVSI